MAKRYFSEAEPKYQLKVIYLWLELNAIPKAVVYVCT